MRLQLMAVALMAPWFAGTAVRAAEVDADTRVNVYADEELTVFNHAGVASVESDDGWRANGHYGVDVISGATRSFLPDAITSATRVEETRVQGGVAGGGVLLPGLRLDGGYLTSKEPDFWSHRANITAVAELFQRRGTLSVTGTLGLMSVGRLGDPAFSEEEGMGGLDVSYAHVLGPATTLTGLFSVGHSLCEERIGCGASPYRYVPVALHDAGPYVALAERHPATHTSAALAARLSQSVRPGLAVHGGYRLFADSWGIVGHTTDTALAQTFLGDRLGLRLDARAYLQGPASFHGDYVLTGGEAPGYRTADRRLGPMADVTLGGSSSLDLPAIGPARLRVHVRVAHAWFRYADAVIPARDAWIAGLGAGATF
ncbi:MAG: DUF3570 domain-containing protein [Deltaproteobacteria bacterium]|nr:DUF3570 domain-containing protein [Deltaproteobacteria bacterium]